MDDSEAKTEGKTLDERVGKTLDKIRNKKLDSFNFSPHNTIIGSLLDDDSYEDYNVKDDDNGNSDGDGDNNKRDHDDDQFENDGIDNDDDDVDDMKDEDRIDRIENKLRSDLYETLHSTCDKDDNTLDSKSLTSADSKWR